MSTCRPHNITYVTIKWVVLFYWNEVSPMRNRINYLKLNSKLLSRRAFSIDKTLLFTLHQFRNQIMHLQVPRKVQSTQRRKMISFTDKQKTKLKVFPALPNDGCWLQNSEVHWFQVVRLTRSFEIQKVLPIQFGISKK